MISWDASCRAKCCRVGRTMVWRSDELAVRSEKLVQPSDAARRFIQTLIQFACKRQVCCCLQFSDAPLHSGDGSSESRNVSWKSAQWRRPYGSSATHNVTHLVNKALTRTMAQFNESKILFPLWLSISMNLHLTESGAHIAHGNSRLTF